MRYYSAFGALGAVSAVVLLQVIGQTTAWPAYVVWLSAWSLVTLGIYGLDKLLSKVSGPRAPEGLLHVLALLGGFPGAWAGVLVLQHKSNRGRHAPLWATLILATVVHLALAAWRVLR